MFITWFVFRVSQRLNPCIVSTCWQRYVTRTNVVAMWGRDGSRSLLVEIRKVTASLTNKVF